MKKLFVLCAGSIFAAASAFAFDSAAIKKAMPSMIEVPENAGIKGFKIAETEVTQKLYAAVMGASPAFFDGENKPVERVSWYDAVFFCNVLSEAMGKKPVYAVNGITDTAAWNWNKDKFAGDTIQGEITADLSADGYRLPTVSEWEHAAREGTKAFKAFSGSAEADEVAWFQDNSDASTKDVAGKNPNGIGIYDMSGNVREWCFDSLGSAGDKKKCHRGGSWTEESRFCEVSNRQYDTPATKKSSIGFRFVSR